MLHLLFMCVYLYVHRESAGQLINTSHCNCHFTTYSGVRVVFFPSRWVCLLSVLLQDVLRTGAVIPWQTGTAFSILHSLNCSVALLLLKNLPWYSGTPRFTVLTYCVSQMFFLFVFLQIEGKTLDRQKRLQLALLRYFIAVVWNQICNKYPWAMPVKCSSLQEMQSVN